MHSDGGSMKTNVAFALAIALIFQLAVATNSFGQDVGLFNGNGIKNQWGSTQDSAAADTNVIGKNARNVLGSNSKEEPTVDQSKWKLPKIDFSKLKPNFQKPKFMQNSEFPRAFEFSDSESGGLLPSFPKMGWPSRDRSFDTKPPTGSVK